MSSPILQEVAFDLKKGMRYNPRCICPNVSCARHGNCVACMAFHKITEHPPTCRYKFKWGKKCGVSVHKRSWEEVL